MSTMSVASFQKVQPHQVAKAEVRLVAHPTSGSCKVGRSRHSRTHLPTNTDSRGRCPCKLRHLRVTGWHCRLTVAWLRATMSRSILSSPSAISILSLPEQYAHISLPFWTPAPLQDGSRLKSSHECIESSTAAPLEPVDIGMLSNS